MSRLLILGVLFAALSTPVLAEPVKQSAENTCGAYSTWVHAVLLKKIGGVPENEVLNQMQKEQGPISPQFAIVLRDIVTAIYSDKMPPVQTAAHVAAIVSLFYESCLEEVRE